MDDLDRMLMEQADEFVQLDDREGAAHVTPWKSSLTFLVWGFLLLSVQVNFFGIPPKFVTLTLGHILIIHGFSRIAHLSPWLRAAFWLSLVSAVWYEVFTILECTPLVMPAAFTYFAGGLVGVARLALFFLLFKALPPFVDHDELRSEVRRRLRNNIWYYLACFGFALLSLFLGIIAALLFLVLLIFILNNLLEVRNLLCSNSYRVQPTANHRITCVRGLEILLVLLLAVGMPVAMYVSGHSQNKPMSQEVFDGSDRLLYGRSPEEVGAYTEDYPYDYDGWYAFWGSYAKDWIAETKASPTKSMDPAKVADIRAQMIRAGIPEAIARSLPSTEVWRYDGITAAYLPEDDHSSIDMYYSGLVEFSSYLCYLAPTDSYRVLVYGHWKEMPKDSYTDALKLYICTNATPWFRPVWDITGGLITEPDGQLTYSRLNFESLGTFNYGFTILTSFQAPSSGERYDFYFGFGAEPYEWINDAGEVYRQGILFVEPYHREQLWCYPYQSPAEALGESDNMSIADILSYENPNRIYTVTDHHYPVFNTRIE